jgi:hypothetical protein
MTDQTTRRASVGAILSITTGVLLADLDDVFGLQDFLAGRALMTHERTIRGDEQTAILLRQFPRLAEVTVPPFVADENGSRERSVRSWVASVEKYLGWSAADVRWESGGEVDMGEALEHVLDLMSGGGSR